MTTTTRYADARKLTLTAPSGGVVSGAPVVIGSIFGVPIASADEGELFALDRNGVHELAKTTGQSWAVGDKLYWNNTTKALTKTSAAGLYLVGSAAAVAGSADTVGLVALDGVAVTAV